MKNKVKKKKYLVTSALPYANGSIHIGHVAGAYLPADIFVRYSRMCGDEVVYICGTDEHGVPITIKASQEGKSPEEVVNYYNKEIGESFKRLDIEFDNFSGTSKEIHHKKSKEFFLELKKNGYIREKVSEEYYCEHDKMFLPDRFIMGGCPACSFGSARGDECPSCGKWLDSDNLVNPRCKLCNNAPIKKETKHWYLRLEKFSDRLREWITKKDYLRGSVRQSALSWINEGLGERAITRDLEWGVKLPLSVAGGESKVLYVWFDAPIGYISSTMEWGKKEGNPDKWKEYWFDKECKLVHFIGKDNIPFHIIVWPSLLLGQDLGYILPYDVPANEHLTIEGKKLSTSEGNVVWVDDFLEYFPKDMLRYYLAAQAPEKKDADFSWKSFQSKINKDLNDTLGNFINRTLSFINKNFGGIIPKYRGEIKDFGEDKEVLKELEEIAKKVSLLLSNFGVRDGIFEVIRLAQVGNRYFDITKPWVLQKTSKERCGDVLNVSVLIIKVLGALLYPFMPSTALRIWVFIGEEEGILKKLRWDDISKMREEGGGKVGAIENLFRRVEDKEVEKLLNLNKRGE